MKSKSNRILRYLKKKRAGAKFIFKIGDAITFKHHPKFRNGSARIILQIPKSESKQENEYKLSQTDVSTGETSVTSIITESELGNPDKIINPKPEALKKYQDKKTSKILAQERERKEEREKLVRSIKKKDDNSELKELAKERANRKEKIINTETPNKQEEIITEDKPDKITEDKQDKITEDKQDKITEDEQDDIIRLIAKNAEELFNTKNENPDEISSLIVESKINKEYEDILKYAEDKKVDIRKIRKSLNTHPLDPVMHDSIAAIFHIINHPRILAGSGNVIFVRALQKKLDQIVNATLDKKISIEVYKQNIKDRNTKDRVAIKLIKYLADRHERRNQTNLAKTLRDHRIIYKSKLKYAEEEFNKLKKIVNPEDFINHISSYIEPKVEEDPGVEESKIEKEEFLDTRFQEAANRAAKTLEETEQALVRARKSIKEQKRKTSHETTKQTIQKTTDNLIAKSQDLAEQHLLLLKKSEELLEENKLLKKENISLKKKNASLENKLKVFELNNKPSEEDEEKERKRREDLARQSAEDEEYARRLVLEESLQPPNKKNLSP
tara:strand:- start:10570 stop:12240 length:1671 start_codon:yes stop_codon:yes gene_type:complete